MLSTNPPAPLIRFPPKTIDMDAYIEKMIARYQWFKRKSNRFKYTAIGSHIDACMFDAYDEGCTDYREYIDSNRLRDADVVLFHRLQRDQTKRRIKNMKRFVNTYRKKGLYRPKHQTRI